MRKLLIGTTALAAAGIVAAPAAFAGEAPSVSVSGQTRIVYMQRDVDGAANADGADGGQIQQANAGTEIRFRASGTADNGLGYGYVMDWRHTGGTTRQTIDESYVHFSGGWGRIHFGGDDGVVENTAKGGQSVLVGNYGYDFSHTGLSNTTSLLSTASWTGNTADIAKVAYYSPSFGGLSFAASITPDFTAGTDNRSVTTINNSAAGSAYGDIPVYEVAAQYNGSFGDVGLGVGGGFAYADGEDGQAEDLEAFHGGATVSIAGFSVGAGYITTFDTTCGTGTAAVVGCEGEDSVTLGAAYSFGSGAVSVGYLNKEGNLNGGATEDELTAFTVDAEYYVAEGLTAYAAYADWEADNDGVETESSYILVGTTVSF